MYEAHYGFDQKPFSIVPNPEMLFLSKNHENALTYLEYGLTEKAGFILLTGEVGAGKTTLIRYLLNKIDTQMDAAVIFNTNFSSDQLIMRILSEFEIDCQAFGKERHLEMLFRFLIDRYAKGRHVLLIIDEAQNLCNDALEDIRMLSNLQTDDQILLQIILVGQPELKHRLHSPAFRQLAQRIAVNYHITSLDEEQTQHYVRYRIQKAGGDPDLFEPEAIAEVYKYSGGIPRTINLLCNTAHVYGFSDNRQRIDAAIVAKVVADQVCISAGIERSSEGDSVEGSAEGGKAGEGEPAGRGVKRVVSGSGGPGIMERLHWLETSLAELKQRHETFAAEVRNELLSKYQMLLFEEQHRLDDLIARVAGMVPLNLPDEENCQAAPHDHLSAGQTGRFKPGTKFSHVMKMARARVGQDPNEE